MQSCTENNSKMMKLQNKEKERETVSLSDDVSGGGGRGNPVSDVKKVSVSLSVCVRDVGEHINDELLCTRVVCLFSLHVPLI